MLTNIYDALEDGGFLMFFEMTTVLPTLLWGLDAQCWTFEDEREFGLWVNQERWVKLLEEVGFTQVRSRPGLMMFAAQGLLVHLQLITGLQLLTVLCAMLASTSGLRQLWETHCHRPLSQHKMCLCSSNIHINEHTLLEPGQNFK